MFGSSILPGLLFREVLSHMVWIFLLVSPFIGSFLGVLARRLPESRPVVLSRSACDRCQVTLTPLDLIPLASWTALRGRCRHCGNNIGLFYPAMECAAMLIVLWASTQTTGLVLVASAILGWIILTLAVCDWLTLKLPDPLTLTLLLTGAMAAFAFDKAHLGDHAIGAVAGFSVFAGIGFRVSQASVSRYMIPRRGRPTQSWATFLRNHAGEVAAIDMFTLPTLGFEWLYAFVALGHGRRRVLHVEVTARPTAQWLAQQITEAFPWDTAPRFLVRDNDRAFGPVFRKRLWAMGIRDRPTQVHSPWQNGHAERLIGSIRRECLDHLIVLNAAHLRGVLRNYADYYNNDRTHLALDKDAPNFRAVERDGVIISRAILGGLHHRYERRPLE